MTDSMTDIQLKSLVDLESFAPYLTIDTEGELEHFDIKKIVNELFNCAMQRSVCA